MNVILSHGDIGDGIAQPAAKKAAQESVRSGQPEYLLGDEAENELRRDRRQLRDHDFAEIALDMIFLGVAVAAMRRDRGLAGFDPASAARYFAALAAGAQAMPWSYCQAALSIIRSAASSSIQDSASGCWMA